MVLTVWGEAYIATFLNLCVPTLLAAGNAPALAAAQVHRLRVFTPPGDAARMAKAPALLALRRHIAVEFVPIAVPGEKDNKYHAITRTHLRALVDARAAGAAVVFLSPDFILADGTLRALAARPAAAAVLMVSPRAALDGVAQALAPLRTADPEGAIRLAPREMMALCLRYPHAVTQSLYWDAPRFSGWPSILQWQADPDTMLARCFHPHPLLLDPARLDSQFGTNTNTTIDGDLLGSLRAAPDEIHSVTDSDELLILELSGPNIAVGLDGAAGGASIDAVVAFARNHATPANRAFLAHHMWYRAGDGDPQAQQAAAARSDAIVSDLLHRLAQPPPAPRLRDRLRRVAGQVKRRLLARTRG